ncbi:MAG: mycothiol system anti-sigma-R factor, partial [Actinomycetota bacterium]
AELEASEISRLRHHLEACSQCSELADAEEHIRNLIRRSCVEHAPETLRARVITQLTILRAQGRTVTEF